MPKPRPFGNVARNIMKEVRDLVGENADVFYEATLKIHIGEDATAIELIKCAAQNDRAAHLGATLALAGQMNAAEELLEEFQRQKTHRRVNDKPLQRHDGAS